MKEKMFKRERENEVEGEIKWRWFSYMRDKIKHWGKKRIKMRNKKWFKKIWGKQDGNKKGIRKS